MSQRWALLLQYEGTEFAGSQWQPHRPTVQGALQDALQSLTGVPTPVSLAGRTDAGVHASGQVGSWVSEWDEAAMPARRWVRGLNHFLPDSVAVQAVAAAPDEFDPRRDAVSRTYTYRIRLARQRQPLWNRRAWVLSPQFDSRAAREVLQALAGEHDFAAFTPPSSERSTVRNVSDASLETRGDSVTFRFCADAFLQHQVRRMVGAVCEVARGRTPAEQFLREFERAEPGSMGPTAPACGLALTRVDYRQPLFSCLDGAAHEIDESG
ncbi:MAG: tRNA pseudouridine(38-40) synthase TruA [Chloroflexi bacterium]|nr:tRNA pseudouridine(38-40) synthase TruA [Chloroflexota bacterium]